MLWSVMISFGVSAVISFLVFLSIFLAVVMQRNKKEKSRTPRPPRDIDPAVTEKMLQPRDLVHQASDPRSQVHQPGPKDSLLPSAPPAEEVLDSYPDKTGDLYPKLESEKDL